jgi:hypothetical protein
VIVDEVPGTTCDHLLAEADWGGYYFLVMDTDCIDPSKRKWQTLLSIGSKDFIAEILRHKQLIDGFSAGYYECYQEQDSKDSIHDRRHNPLTGDPTLQI